MNTEVKNSRNNTVDAIRGIAMLMVVLQHTISVTAPIFHDSFFFNMIWSIQMPLFFIISGYVTRYSKPITTSSKLLHFIKKRSLSYLLPWAIWTFLIRGFLCEQKIYLDVKYLLWHMDTGYWFLVSLWTIVILYGLTDYLSNKISKNLKTSLISHCVLMGLLTIPVILLGYYAGFNFLSIKLTLYYIPLYFCGYLFGQLQSKTDIDNHTVSQIVASTAALIWIYVITRYSFFSQAMTVNLLVARYLASVMGSIVAIYCISVICKWGGVFLAGKYSLEIYVLHYLFLNMLKTGSQTDMSTVEGFLMVIINYTVTISVTALVIRIIQKNEFLAKVLFAR